MASPEEVAAFEEDQGDGPSLEDFRPYWDTLDCRWNNRLAELFADELLSENPALGRDPETRQSVFEHFGQRLESLRKQLKLQETCPDETPEQASSRVRSHHGRRLASCRVRERQVTLYGSRLRICREMLNTPNSSDWELLLNLVATLQAEGQSSDDSETEETCIVRSRSWRHPDVTALLRLIDGLREKQNNAEFIASLADDQIDHLNAQDAVQLPTHLLHNTSSTSQSARSQSRPRTPTVARSSTPRHDRNVFFAPRHTTPLHSPLAGPSRATQPAPAMVGGGIREPLRGSRRDGELFLGRQNGVPPHSRHPAPLPGPSRVRPRSPAARGGDFGSARRGVGPPAHALDDYY
ncbi:hypothetical protein H0H92_000306 [Tricholoma furcatifolium]|nr:hypothetical protein H0H92_000306 [Tricholoma furcatifolium]